MATALGLWKARRLAAYGIAWEKSLPQEVWIFTDCQRRLVYASYDEAVHWYELLRLWQGKCDALYREKWCIGKHTLLRGVDEIPVASFEMRLHRDMLSDPQGRAYFRAEMESVRADAVRDLPEFSIIPSSSPTSGVVYVLRAEDTPRLKIGRSISPQIRLETLQTASPYPLTVLLEIPTRDTSALEAALHRRYAKYRKHGEWFEMPPLVESELISSDFT